MSPILSYHSAENKSSKSWEGALHTPILELNGSHVDTCQFCKTPLRYAHDGGNMSTQWDTIVAAVCFNCGWWWFHWKQGWEAGVSFDEASAILRSFDIDSTDAPSNELAKYLAKKPDMLGTIAPAKMEELVADVFRDVLGCRIEHCSYARPDKGLDVIGLHTEDGQRFGVQVKRYRHPIKLGMIHQLFGALFDAGIENGVFVTSGRFQRGCHDTKERLEERSNITIDLIDGKRFLEFLEVLNSSRKDAVYCPRWQRDGGYIERDRTCDYPDFDSEV